MKGALAPRLLAVVTGMIFALGLGIAGLLVGLGSRLSGGCTSGHGVCGLSLRSPRALIATLAFMAAGVATVAVAKVLLGVFP